MSAPDRRWPNQLSRLFTLIVPPAVAWQQAFTAPHPSRLTFAVVHALGPLWLLSASALAVRSAIALRPRHRSDLGATPLLDRLDVLTPVGAALSLSAAAAILLSVWIGWASLAVVGLMGTALLHLTVLWTLIVAGGRDPFRRASVTRRFVPSSAVAGTAITEEVTFDRPRIPTGFRLLAQGRVGPRWTTSRYLLDESFSHGEVVLESDLGPALRGEHQAEPLELWLQDVFGLCRSVRVRAGEAAITVLPEVHPVVGARALLGPGGAEKEPRPTTQRATEGSLRLREYQPGDDARRVHWVRSLASRELIVRLPDELPPDQPAVRVLLDTFLPGAESFTCSAPAALLDSLVEVWLSVGRALADAGARVTLVLPVPHGDGLLPRELRLSSSSASEAQRLGASARWQASLPAEGLLTGGACYLVSCRVQPLLVGAELTAKARWIVVAEPVWTCFDDPIPARAIATTPHPLGSSDNRWTKRTRERLRWWRSLAQHTAFTQHTAGMVGPKPASFAARPVRPTPSSPRQIRLEAL